MASHCGLHRAARRGEEELFISGLFIHVATGITFMSVTYINSGKEIISKHKEAAWEKTKE